MNGLEFTGPQGLEDAEGILTEVVDASKNGRWKRLLQSAKGPEEADESSMAYDTENGHMVVWNQTTFLTSTKKRQLADVSSGFKNIQTKFEKLKMIRHDNIVQFIDFWHDDKHEAEGGSTRVRIVWITEHITMGTLKRHLRKQAKNDLVVPLKIWKRWCRQILSALRFLHAHQLPHGNIKPTTIHVQHNGAIKIGVGCIHDFHEGIKTMRKENKSAEWAYLAPELIESQGQGYLNITPMDSSDSIAAAAIAKACLVDVYAFGIVALEMITLTTPYAEHATIYELEKARLEDMLLPKSLTELSDLDKRKSFILECLKPPDSRPTPALLMQNELLYHVPRLQEFAAHEVVRYIKKMEIEAAEQESTKNNQDDEDEEFDPKAPRTYSLFDTTKFVDVMLYDKYAKWFSLPISTAPHLPGRGPNAPTAWSVSCAMKSQLAPLVQTHLLQGNSETPLSGPASAKNGYVAIPPIHNFENGSIESICSGANSSARHIEDVTTLMDEVMKGLRAMFNVRQRDNVPSSQDLKEQSPSEAETSAPAASEIPATPGAPKEESRRVYGQPICVVNEDQDQDIKYEINVTLYMKQGDNNLEDRELDVTSAPDSLCCERRIVFKVPSEAASVETNKNPVPSIVLQMVLCGLINDEDRPLVEDSITAELESFKNS